MVVAEEVPGPEVGEGEHVGGGKRGQVDVKELGHVGRELTLKVEGGGAVRPPAAPEFKGGK